MAPQALQGPGAAPAGTPSAPHQHSTLAQGRGAVRPVSGASSRDRIDASLLQSHQATPPPPDKTPVTPAAQQPQPGAEPAAAAATTFSSPLPNEFASPGFAMHPEAEAFIMQAMGAVGEGTGTAATQGLAAEASASLDDAMADGIQVQHRNKTYVLRSVFRVLKQLEGMRRPHAVCQDELQTATFECNTSALARFEHL